MKKNYNPELVAGAAIRDDKGRRISKLFESSHPKMVAGYAKNLIMPDTPEEQDFNFRQAGGGVIEDGVAVIDKVKGKSVVWNQIMKDNDTHKVFQGPQSWEQLSSSTEPFHLLAGHKYLGICRGQLISGGQLGLRDGVAGLVHRPNTGYVIFFNSDKNYDNAYLQCYWTEDGVADFYVSFIDLTQMFGAGNEPATYEDFIARKPFIEDEYAHNEGTIVSNNIEAVKVQGSNLATSDILLLTNFGGAEFANAFLHRGTYCISLDIPQTIALFVALFDKNGNNISGSASSLGEGWVLNSSRVWWYNTIYSGGELSFSLAKDAIVSIKTNATLSQTTRIMLNVGTTLLPYEPYEEHTLALDWVKEIKDENGAALFPDGLRSAGTAYDEVRSGKAIKRVGAVDLGTLNWSLRTSGEYKWIEGRGVNNKYGNDNVVCCKYIASKATSVVFMGDKMIKSDNSSNGYIYVTDSTYTDAAAFKAAMQGVMLYYELAEPIEVEYDEKNLTYPVVAGGMEEALASGDSTPFRADIGYGIDAVKTILKNKADIAELKRQLANGGSSSIPSGAPIINDAPIIDEE